MRRLIPSLETIFDNSRVNRRVAAVVVAVSCYSACEVISASAANFYDQVFGEQSPGYHTYNSKSRSYRRESRDAAIASPGAQDFRSKAHAVGRIDKPARAPRPTRVERIPRTVLGGTYRTMCVRECDGYYYPVSFATSKDNLQSDAQACASSCGAPVRLYYYPNPGGRLEDMVALDSGESYAALKNAFLYRKKFVADCRCQPEPWTAEAKAVHARHALAAADPQQQVAQAEAAAVRITYGATGGQPARSGSVATAGRQASQARTKDYYRRQKQASSFDQRYARPSRLYRDVRGVRLWTY